MKSNTFLTFLILACITSLNAQAPLSWQATPSLDSFPIRCFLSTPNALFIGMYGGGIQKTTDEGQTWTSCNQGLPQYEYIIRGATQIGNILFVGTRNHGVWYSDNEGELWKTATDSVLSPYIWSMASLDNRLFAGTTFGLFFSDDLGKHWQEIELPIPRAASGLIYAMATHDQTVIACSNRYLYCSKDAGSTWKAIEISKEKRDLINAVYGNGKFYVGTSGDGLYSSEDGLTWERITDHLTDNQQLIQAILVFDNQLITSISSTGIMRDWQTYNDFLPIASVSALTAYKGKLYAGTAFDGVWKLDNWNNTTTQNELSAVPNLVSDTPIQFSYQLNESSNVKLLINNQSGQTIATLVNTFQNPGNYQVEYTTSTLQAGTYFATLYIGNKQTKSKFIIIH
ncbi:MAG: hypothetical protein HC892_11460 [Saprospiraceae bacterium]|nr:hypothetical protein [Saprospiraceae bacterium]